MMWQEEGCIMYEIIPREFQGHDFVPGLRTLKPLKKQKKLKTFSLKI